MGEPERDERDEREPGFASFPDEEGDAGSTLFFVLGLVATMFGVLLVILFAGSYVLLSAEEAGQTLQVADRAGMILGIGFGLTVLGLGLLAAESLAARAILCLLPGVGLVGLAGVRLLMGESWSLPLLAVGVCFVAGGFVAMQWLLGDEIGRERIVRGTNAGLQVLLAFVLLVLVNYVTYNHNLWRWDLTEGGKFTLSDESRRLAESLERPIKLIFIHGRLSGSQRESVEAVLQQLEHASPRIEVERYEPDRMDRKELENWAADLDLEGSYLGDLYGVIVETGRRDDEGEWERGNRKHVLLRELWTREQLSSGRSRPLFQGERKIGSAILEVIDAERPKIYFLEGHAEQSITAYDERKGLGRLANQLRQRNYELEAINLLHQPDRAVPADADLLVIAGPRRRLAESEVEAVSAFLRRGGDALILLDPITERGDRDAYVPTGLEGPLAAGFGVEVVDRKILGPTSQQGRFSTQFVAEETGDGQHPIVKELLRYGQPRFLFAEARPLREIPDVQGLYRKAIAKTTSEADVAPLYQSAADPRVPEQWEADGPYTLAIAVERLHEPAEAEPAEGRRAEDARATRVVAVGDADWMSNAYLNHPAGQNLELALNAIAWCVAREELTVGKATEPTNYRMVMDRDLMLLLVFLSAVGVPVFALCGGIFVWVMRRR